MINIPAIYLVSIFIQNHLCRLSFYDPDYHHHVLSMCKSEFHSPPCQLLCQAPCRQLGHRRSQCQLLYHSLSQLLGQPAPCRPLCDHRLTHLRPPIAETLSDLRFIMILFMTLSFKLLFQYFPEFSFCILGRLFIC